VIPAKNGTPAPNNVNCNTKLPNGQTVGQYVNNARAQLQAVVDRQNALAPAGDVNPFSIYTQFASIAKGGGPIDFKNIFAGQASRELLANAGNFAYYAIGEGYIPTTALDLGAGAYGLYGAAVGRFPTSFLTGRFFSDDSARLMRSPGLAANGCPQ